APRAAAGGAAAPAVGVLVVVGGDPAPADRAEPPPRHSLDTPRTAGGWTLDRTPAGRARAAEQVAAVGDIGALVVFAEYARAAGGALAFLGLVPDPDSELGRELARPRTALAGYLASAGVPRPTFADAGALGGALACAAVTAPRVTDQLTSCGWADATTLGVVTYAIEGLSLPAAAELTRDFRQHVTVDAP
uniref:hypothetical protein n=1 Tax=Nocardioides sp. SYSU D00038 TaxID=2812554 RepID=UPI001967EDB7